MCNLLTDSGKLIIDITGARNFNVAAKFLKISDFGPKRCSSGKKNPSKL